MKPKHDAPSRKLNLKFKLDSTLINSKHIPLFASWIDKKDSLHYNRKNIPYDFKLLHCSSRDGFNTKTFHKNCDNKGATIWVAKVQGSTQLIGGYNPLDWNGSGVWKSTTRSFVFNFTDGKNLSTAKLGYVNNDYANYALHCNSMFGPHMGDLACDNPNNWRYNTNYYPNMDIPANFRVDDYEVFQVIKQ